MKIAPNILFSLIAFLFGIVNVIAKAKPPAPTQKTLGPAVPPGFPIDENLFILLIVALLYGIYIIYDHRLKTKTPI